MLTNKFVPNLKKVEIEITTDCNLRCSNCDRSCRQAPSSEFMSLEQIQKFVEESIELKWDWEHIRIMGGEPTLHPDLFKIIRALKKYKLFQRRKNKDCKIELLTNGFGPKTSKILKRVPFWVYLQNSAKESLTQSFHTYNVASVDLKSSKKVDFSTGCRICSRDGLGLTRYGFYPCGAGASVDRVFGKDIGIKNLKDVSVLNLTKQLKILCLYCGHFKYHNPNVKKVKKEIFSKSWKDAYEQYKIKKPGLTLY